MILTALGGGALAYAAYDKTVQVTVDGQARTVHTFASTVGAVLDKVDVQTGVHDVVKPAIRAHLSNGQHVVVEHGRPLHLVLDGNETIVWVTADTVESALAQLGITDVGTYVSAAMSRPVPLDGLGLVVRVPHRVTILHDGSVTRVTTTAATVRDALVAAKVRLAKSDRVSVPLRVRPRDGLVVSVTRVARSTATVTEAIAYDTRRIADSSMYRGAIRVVNPGREGVRTKTYAIVKFNGSLNSRRLISSKVLRDPQTRVVRFGTKPRPSSSGDVGNSSVDNLNWYALAGCESGHDPRAYSPGGPYYGLYQFTQGTWEGVGGSGDPRDASEGEQTYRAKRLYMNSGAGNWPTCGHYLYE